MIIASIGSFRLLLSGRGPYVVIDNRNKFNEDADDTSSNEGTSFDLCYMLPLPHLRCQIYLYFPYAFCLRIPTRKYFRPILY